MAKFFDICKFNKILQDNNQNLRAKKITGKEIVISNEVILISKRDIRLCKNRVMNGDKIWRENFDKLYSINIEERLVAEKECRSKTSRQGGINCQKKHRNTIKENLNTGIPWNKGLKGNYPYHNNHSNETKEKISMANKGQNNGMFGKTMPQEEKDFRSRLMKEKIISGKFTPNSNNRNTHWDSYYKNKKYRSSWEALYQYFDEHAEYETLRISYFFENKEYVYIIDFVNHKTKIVAEVKPKELLNDKKTIEKIKSVKNWCKLNNYQFLIVDKDFLINLPAPKNLSLFDNKTQEKIKKLYEIN
jgi:hypothetical protein